MADLKSLLSGMRGAGASDLHFKSGSEPRYRVSGELVGVPGWLALPAEATMQLLRTVIDEEQARLFSEEKILHFSFSLPAGAPGSAPGGARFRACFYQDQYGPSAAFRLLDTEIPSFPTLNLPPSVESFAHLRSGLVLVTGASGSGKTTTLASLIDIINSEYRRFVIALEDPIEYLYESRNSVILQRGLHYDFTDFRSGLEAAIQQNPDVLLVGELRDASTIHLALSAAEAGMLVYATLHTNGAVETINRVIDVFPSGEQPQARAMLSQCLAGVVSQVLIRRSDHKGQMPVCEILVANGAVSNLIREGKVQDIASIIQSGRAYGMVALDEALEQVCMSGIVDPDDAYLYARNKSRIEPYLLGPRGLANAARYGADWQKTLNSLSETVGPKEGR